MPDTKEPSIRKVGAIASLNHEEPEDRDFAIVDLRLYALIGGGDRVVDPQPASARVRCERTKLAALELSVQMSLRLRQPPSGARLEAWQRIAGELASRGIETDATTLHGTPFEFSPDDELRAAQQAVWPHPH
ncbi:MAG: hypothetical protein QOD83_407 [Solirubrobacteraceae bacterium]|jgi:hypothetical protein|nr:hypothetical protein [Solirubrobacteraceae bacterium]MEA2230591.1 hypothetical protein [Solirubrobacteraceae bacterium]